MRNKLSGFIVILAAALPAWGQTLQPVTTRAFDNGRSGANTHETILTRDNVVAKGIRRVTIIRSLVTRVVRRVSLSFFRV
jgi:hypothetical protein